MVKPSNDFWVRNLGFEEDTWDSFETMERRKQTQEQGPEEFIFNTIKCKEDVTKAREHQEESYMNLLVTRIPKAVEDPKDLPYIQLLKSSIFLQRKDTITVVITNVKTKNFLLCQFLYQFKWQWDTQGILKFQYCIQVMDKRSGST